MQDILIGQRIVPNVLDGGPMDIRWDGPLIRPHQSTSWLFARLRERHDVDPLSISEPLASGEFRLERWRLGYHAGIFGASGSGKTRLSLHLLRCQLRAGCSAVVIDYKTSTAREAARIGLQSGLKSSQITVLWPSEPDVPVPGWNPFGVPLADAGTAADRFVAAVRADAQSWGPRLGQVLKNAATVVSAQHLSVLELRRFLQRDDYREGLLRKAWGTPAWATYPEQHEYFRGQYEKVAKTDSPGSALEKFSDLVDRPFLKALLCAHADTLDIPGLWKRQRLVIVHLDEYELGEEGAKTLSGMIVHRLYQTCMRKPGNVPVQLVLDELASHERCLGKALINIVEKGREQGLWLLGSGQHFAALSPEFQSLLSGSTGFQAFFKLGQADARKVASALCEGGKTRLRRVAVSAGAGKEPAYEILSVPVQYPDGREVRMDMETYWRVAALSGKERADAFREWACGTRLYARVLPDSAMELLEFLEGPWNVDVFSEAPDPLRLTLRYPVPKVDTEAQETSSQREASVFREIMTLAVGQAFVVAGRDQAQVAVLPMPKPKTLPDMSTFRNGRTAEESTQTFREREAEVERVAGAAPESPPKPARKAVPKADPTPMPALKAEIPEMDEDGNL